MCVWHTCKSFECRTNADEHKQNQMLLFLHLFSSYHILCVQIMLRFKRRREEEEENDEPEVPSSSKRHRRHDEHERKDTGSSPRRKRRHSDIERKDNEDGDIRLHLESSSPASRVRVPFSQPRAPFRFSNEALDAAESAATREDGSSAVVAGGEDDDGSAPIEVYDSIPFDDNNWDDVEEEDTDDPNYCFFCDCGQTQSEMEQNPIFCELVLFLDDNFHRVDPKHLCKEAQRVYNEELREFYKPDKVWYQRTIYRHITEHAPSTKVRLEDVRRTLYSSMVMLRDSGLIEEERTTKRRRVNEKNMNLYLRIFKELRPMFTDSSRDAA